MKVLSLCTSAGLWDKAFQAAGCAVTAGCEIMSHKRDMYRAFVDPGTEFLAYDLKDVPNWLHHGPFDLIIGGIPCQSRSKTRAMRPDCKFPDLLPALLDVLRALPGVPYLLENVAPLDIPGAQHAALDAMHYAVPHQSRLRHFTFSPGLVVPPKVYEGTVDTLMAYPAVAARIYGPKRGAVLQGWPEFASLRFPCAQLQEALADGVPRGLADAWISANHWRTK
jgi:hypothetical protein